MLLPYQIYHEQIKIALRASYAHTECKAERKADMEYRYGMRLRGFSPMCQPMNGLVRREDDPTGKYWDILVYDRQLAPEEVRSYDLDELK